MIWLNHHKKLDIPAVKHSLNVFRTVSIRSYRLSETKS